MDFVRIADSASVTLALSVCGCRTPQGEAHAPTTAPAPPPGSVEVAPAQDEAASTTPFRDPEDGAFDVSGFLESAHGFLPLVMPITEPAVGYGAAVAAMFLDPRESAGDEGWARPNITAAGGMATENGSAGGFAFNSTIWGEGDLHTLAGGGVLGLELDLYGIGEDPTLESDPIGYELDATFAVGEGRARLGATDFWATLRAVWADMEVTFDESAAGVPGVDASDADVTIAGPMLGLRYDSLDSMFTPTRGTLSDTQLSIFDEAFGGSRDYQIAQQVLIHHRPLSESWFLGVRGDAKGSFGDTPFFQRPYIALRGIPSLRYQGEFVLQAQVEARWAFERRFSLVGFGGGGVALAEIQGLERDQDAYAGGLGLRYELARKFGLHAGIDVARGPEETAIYVVVGNSWLRP